MLKQTIGHVVMVLTIVLATQSCTAIAKNSEPVTMTGTIRVIGNEPLTHLVLTARDNTDRAVKNGDYLIIGPLSEELRNRYQGKAVTLEGTICTSPSPEFTRCFKPTRIVTVKDGQ
jgi:hypothetical protein